MGLEPYTRAGPEEDRDLALKESELSPRELAVRFTDPGKWFVSEASVYRIFKAHDLITSPAYVALSAADEFKAACPDRFRIA